jgi:hypothetical protein
MSPEQRRTWMTGKEVVTSVSLNTPLGMTGIIQVNILVLFKLLAVQDFQNITDSS